MKLIKTALICSCILAICFVSVLTDRSFAEKKSKQASIKNDVVIGHLQTRDRVVTISKGQKGIAYTVKTRDGKTLDANLNEKNFQAKYQSLYDQIKDGRAGNDATLRRGEATAVPPHPERHIVTPGK